MAERTNGIWNIRKIVKTENHIDYAQFWGISPNCKFVKLINDPEGKEKTITGPSYTSDSILIDNNKGSWKEESLGCVGVLRYFTSRRARVCKPR